MKKYIDHIKYIFLNIEKEDMSKTYCQQFSDFWARIYANQFKTSDNYAQQKAIKENLYKNIHMTDDEKDEIWEKIILLSGYLTE